VDARGARFDFEVEFAPGRTLTIPDTLSRDAVGEPLCTKCREGIRMISEKARGLTIDEIRTVQEGEFRNLVERVPSHKDLLWMKTTCFARWTETRFE